MECELKDVNDFYDPKTFTDSDPESLKDMNTDLSLNSKKLKILSSFDVHHITDFVHECKNIELVAHKIKNAPSIWHNIKPKYLATVEGMMKKFFRTEIFKLRNEEGEYQVKLKLILTETGIWPKLPCFLNQTILRFAKSAALVKLGLVHAAIQLGPYLIDWTRDADLVSIRPIKSEKAMVVADLDKGLLYKGRDVRQVEKVLRLLCSKMVYWNVHRTFSFKKRNCQVFTTDILRAVGCDYKFSCKIDEYFRFLSKVGYSSERIFSNPIDSTEEKFLTHKQLDDYVNKILEDHPSFEEDFPNEWDLLKSFDRAFWVGYVNVDDPKKENVPSCECPFSNPLLTASFLPYKLEFSGDLMLPREK